MRAMKPAPSAPPAPPIAHPPAFYVGRLVAFHSVLNLTSPGQPRFGELKLRPDDDQAQYEAALYAVYRRLGSALSRLSLEQREALRAETMDLARKPPRKARAVGSQDPDYYLALNMAYRQIISALDMRQSASEWLV